MSSNKKVARVQELETLSVLATFFLILSIVTHRQAFVYIAVALLAVALFLKPAASTISRAWLKFAEVVGTFNSKVILTLVFYGFLTPIAFLYRMFTKNPLMLKARKDTTTFYTERHHTYTASDLEKMW